MLIACQLVLFLVCLSASAASAAEPLPLAGADECTPSKAQYFSWINNTNEGSNEAQTLINLAFFRWLHDEYGMKLDIYAWDAGNLDGAGTYGTMSSERFRTNYPRGWKPLSEAAAAFDCRLGLWGGPDGFGKTPQDAAARIELMSSLCRDYGMALFKFDGVCGHLRPEHQDDFVAMMEACRRYSPDLILLNHRLRLGKGMPHATTSLWNGTETYIDVHLANTGTAPHHRAGALGRGLPPKLTRLTEDHGVCLSSCLDGWEDDLVLQAFSRSLILAPEIYGNPWLLRDDEYPMLARIYNLHRRFRPLLTQGEVLPKDYGHNAVARGDAATRLVTLRNLTWQPVTYQVALDERIGLSAPGEVELRRFHPHERVLGRFAHGATVAVEVPPFRSCLLLASAAPIAELGVAGCDAEVVRDVPGKPFELALLGLPGTTATVTLHPGHFAVTAATIDGQPLAGFAAGTPTAITFPGQALIQPVHRKLADLAPCAVPADAQALYEATCFAADSDALEVRSLRRSGPTAIPAVQRARDAFFFQDLLRTRGCLDRLLFDGDAATAFAVKPDGWRSGAELAPPTAQLRLDLGATVSPDRLTIRLAGGTTTGTAEVSADLLTWQPAVTTITPAAVVIEPPHGPMRYLRLTRGTLAPSECDGLAAGKPMDRSAWRASNLFPAYAARAATAAWTTTVTVSEAAPRSQLCIALDGKHGAEGAWVAVRLHGRPIGCPDRAPSFVSNVWEYKVRAVDCGYTYYLPLTPELVGQQLDIVALTLGDGVNSYQPSVWLTSPRPEVRRLVRLEVAPSTAR